VSKFILFVDVYKGFALCGRYNCERYSFILLGENQNQNQNQNQNDDTLNQF
jgi:hypothetical protein